VGGGELRLLARARASGSTARRKAEAHPMLIRQYADTTIGDLFAGGGGVGAGVAGLPGVRVIWAANHWRVAIEHQARRYPGVELVCQDLCQYDFRRMPNIDILWASPACTGHSEAAQPARARDADLANAHDHLRATAWAVVSAVMAKRPRAFIVENVREFQEWTWPDVTLESCASLHVAQRRAAWWIVQETARLRGGDAKIVIVKRKQKEVTLVDGRKKTISTTYFDVVRRSRKGILYQQWLDLFRSAGYYLTEHICTATRWGDPQRRARFILVGHLAGEIHLVEPGGPEATLRPILDFEAGPWMSIAKMNASGKRSAAQARAQYAHDKFKGAPCWGQHVSHTGAWGRNIDQPCTTLTTQNQHYLVRDGEYRLFSVEESAQVMSFDRDYFDDVDRTNALIMAGNAVCVLKARGICKQVSEAIAA
jgi:site-specific DNA-cytosine methylase